MMTSERGNDGTLIMRIERCVVILMILNASGFNAQTTHPSGCLNFLDREPSTVICARQRLETLPVNISDLVEILDLSSNLLQEIPIEINRLTELRTLVLSRNRLSALPESLHGLNKLLRLDLTGNKIKDVADIISVRQLSSLKVLYLAGNQLSGLEGLENLNLQALDAGRCAIREINNASFTGLPSMITLSLAGNPLRLINRPRSDALKWLDMSDCQINYLSPDAFEDMPNLDDLRMPNNPTLVYSTRYETLTHARLKRLDVSRCNLDRPGLHGLPSLTHAKLSRNLIRILPDRIFAKNKELTQLSLSANGLDQLNTSSFVGLIKLEILDLSSNALQNIHWTTFRENINLRLLNLSYNTLFEFPNLTTAATLLDMSANLVYSFKSDVLMNMPRLKTVNLSNNRLEDIPNNLESQSLKILYLRQNRLVQLTNESFISLPGLQKIDLSGNRLTEAPDPEIFSMAPRLQEIGLDDNPWRCDCKQLFATFAYLSEPPSKTIASNLICQSPSNVSGFSWENACYEAWSRPMFSTQDRAWGLIMISLLVMAIIFGSVVSLRHAMKMKRETQLQRREIERAEARERLRLLQRRNQRLEEELMEQSSAEPRIHPMELIGPPSYEEAVHMPRLAHSMDALDAISVDSVPSHVLGSVDNLRSKKRRSRRPRKRAQSEENLARRESRREERRRRSLERINSLNNLVDSVQSPESTNESNPTRSLSSRSRPTLRSEPEAGDTNRGRPRPQTPAARLKKRRRAARNGHSSDDEDSGSENRNIVLGDSIVIQNLPREPRSGYRPTPLQDSDF